MKILNIKPFVYVSLIAFLVSCASIKMPEPVIRIETFPVETYRMDYPFLPIEGNRDCVNFGDTRAIYDSVSNRISLKFALKNKGKSYYFGAGKTENRYLWCLVRDSVNGNIYNIGNFSVKEFMEVKNPRIAVSIVLDHSGSMGDRAFLLQDAVNEMIGNKRKDDAFGIIKFDTKIVTEVPFMSDRNELLKRFRRNGLSDFGGRTALNDALNTAVNLVDGQNGYDNKIVLVFTDGAENASNIKDPGTIISKAKTRNIKFYIIDFGNETDSYYNQRLARETNGRVYKIYQSVEINNIFDEVYGNLTLGPLMYEVSYIPPEPLGKHYPRIELCFDYCTVKEDFNPVGFNLDMVLLNIQFDFNDYAIRGAENQKEIVKVANYLKENPKFRIRLEGHTDCRGTAASQKILSENRARSVKDELQKLGIDRSRIETLGFGFEQPHMITADDLTRDPLLRQNLVIGTELNCDLVNSFTSNALREATHQLNRRTKMVIIR